VLGDFHQHLSGPFSERQFVWALKHGHPLAVAERFLSVDQQFAGFDDASDRLLPARPYLRGEIIRTDTVQWVFPLVSLLNKGKDVGEPEENCASCLG